MFGLFAILGFASVLLAFSNGQLVETTDEQGQEWIAPIRKCPLGTDEELNSCLRQIVLDLTPLSASGISELGVQPLDPFKLGKFEYDEKIGPFNIKIKSKNVVLHGLTKYRSLDFNVDRKNQIMSFEYVLPSVRVEADYKLGGNVIIPLSGSGPANVEVFDVKVVGHFAFNKLPQEDGQTIVQLQPAIIEKMTISRQSLRVRGLFNGNPIISGFIHYVANTYGPQVFEFIKPQVTSIIGDVLTNDILNPLLSKLPYLTNYF